jgi:fructose-1,6-bisphosphatase
MPENYPMVHIRADERFSASLVADVARVLVRHGYPDPRPCARDTSRLHLALFRFLYGTPRR